MLTPTWKDGGQDLRGRGLGWWAPAPRRSEPLPLSGRAPPLHSVLSWVLRACREGSPKPQKVAAGGR